MVFDTHTHAYFDVLRDRENELLANMDSAGVRFAVQIGCDARSSKEAVAIAKRHPEKYAATVGLHPTEAQEMDEYHISAEIGELEAVLLENRANVVAIGETGWDFHHLSDDPNRAELQKLRQQLAFEAQISLAKRYGLPIVIHTRDSSEALLETLRHEKLDRAVIHCYSEDPVFAEKALALCPGIMFGFSGILTYKSAATVQATAKSLPLDRILVETDAPFLSPQSVRGTVNESANVRHVMEFLKSLRSESDEEIERAVWENSIRFYSLQIDG